MMLTELKVDKLEVNIYSDRVAMGNAAAGMVCDRITQLLTEQQFVNMIFAAAPSQNEFLAALIQRNEVEWGHVNAFHMDEYMGLPEGGPNLFSSFLKGKLFKHLPFRSVNYLNGNAQNMQTECDRYAKLLLDNPTDMVCMGI